MTASEGVCCLVSSAAACVICSVPADVEAQRTLSPRPSSVATTRVKAPRPPLEAPGAATKQTSWAVLPKSRESLRRESIERGLFAACRPPKPS